MRTTYEQVTLSRVRRPWISAEWLLALSASSASSKEKHSYRPCESSAVSLYRRDRRSSISFVGFRASVNVPLWISDLSIIISSHEIDTISDAMRGRGAARCHATSSMKDFAFNHIGVIRIIFRLADANSNFSRSASQSCQNSLHYITSRYKWY